VDIAIDRSRLLGNLERLMLAHAPSGQEAEIDQQVDALLAASGRVPRLDAAGSTIVHIPGTGAAPPVAVAAHKDEIALIVKRVEANGRLRVQPVGGLHPWAVGEAPVEVLARPAAIPGVLSVGSKHVSGESPGGQLKSGTPLTWETMWVETMLDEQALRAAGVGVGQRVVMARSRKQPWYVGNRQYVCGYNLDCRAGLAILAEAAVQLAARPPAGDVYLIASTEEEVGAHGVQFSVRQLPVDTLIAVDVAPVAEEYQTRNSADPVLLCKDNVGVYHTGTIDHLARLAAGLGFGVQLAVVTSYGSDASLCHAHGLVARAAVLGYPGDNTHGFEICHADGLANTARLLLAFLWDADMSSG
jgi:putative aminopeptidase FrvX